MKKKEIFSHWRHLILSMFLLLLTFSCQDDSVLIDSPSTIDNLITESEALRAAENFVLTNTFSDARVIESSTKSIENMVGVQDESSLVVCYIINYAEGGFLVLSADNRVMPVLAFSDENSFPVVEDKYPNGIEIWLNEVKVGMKAVVLSDLEQSEDIKKQWDSLLNLEQLSFEAARTSGMDDCQWAGQIIEDVTIKNPLTQTEWGQGRDYNNDITLDCGNDEALVGCMAVAMAQIMRYHEIPSAYDWDNMPNTIASAEIAELLYDIGVDVNMQYTCLGSYPPDETVADDVFENDYGYSSANFTYYNHNTVKSHIYGNRPVYLRGDGSYGHAWVADGYMQVDRYECEENPYEPGEFWKTPVYSALYFRYNWGWYGDYNGHYAYNNWSVAGDSFNNNKRMCTVIP